MAGTNRIGYLTTERILHGRQSEEYKTGFGALFGVFGSWPIHSTCKSQNTQTALRPAIVY